MDVDAPTSAVATSLSPQQAGEADVSASQADEPCVCPICRGAFSDPFVAPCGHSFCHNCINTHLATRANCPACGAFAATERLVPNYALSLLAGKVGAAKAAAELDPAARLQNALAGNELRDINEVRELVGALMVHEERLKQEASEAKLSVLLDFLHLTRQEKLTEAAQLRAELECIEDDLGQLQAHKVRFDAVRAAVGKQEQGRGLGSFFTAGRAAEETGEVGTAAAALAVATRRVEAVDADLQQLYTAARCPRDAPQAAGEAMSVEDRSGADTTTAIDAVVPAIDAAGGKDAAAAPRGAGGGLAAFMETLATFTRFTQLRETAALAPPAASSRSGSMNIISSIEFDCAGDLFATAGVSKRIAVYSFAELVNSPPDEASVPNLEINTRSKLSCLCWSHQKRSHLVSSDYEGMVTLWDTEGGSQLTEYDEHEKRVWSVDCAEDDPTRILSGSDDCRCKLWSTRQQDSVMTLELKANVCCVRFNPHNSYQVALGSADHHVHSYDLRQPRQPLHVFTGHTKAVSYVRYLSETELVSASTDNTLKLWDVERNRLARTLRGHVNEKNFIGLSTNRDFLACGSETNELFVYHRQISSPAMSQLFTAPGEAGWDNANLFISAVCWRPGTSSLLAANSTGGIKAFTMER